MPSSANDTTKLLNIRSLLFICLIAVIYITTAAFLINVRLVTLTLEGSYPALYKLTLLKDLILGIFNAIGLVDSILFTLNALLVGINFLLIAKTIRTIEGMGKVKMSIGGVALISLVTAGCGACGFTIFSLVGVTTSLSFLPFHGTEIHVISFLVLAFSAWYMIRKLLASRVCKLY